ncbi:hypothetical protein SteCoe_30591 [Stentor coeruleus]|uniref:Uncharacterized protein n=1 Tax=Stentor coeruleus TaxID=5963 RepID=A0A1R2B3C0_9CILI|nr:hypothetical protein SteCoe_30591 [Stentor coeruleus]
MKSTGYSNYESRCQSTTSKSNNSSVSSILKDTSISRPKTRNKVRFEDSPETSNMCFSYNQKDHEESEFSNYNKPHSANNIDINLNDSISSMKISTPISVSPSNKFFNKQRIATDKNYSEPWKAMKTTNRLSSGNIKQSPVKVVAVHEVCDEVSEPRFIPKVINYAFRNQDFYEKLSKFYTSPEKSPENRREKIFIKLDPSLIGKGSGLEKNKSDKEGQTSVIRLKSCSILSPGKEKDIRGRSLSPTRDKASPLKKNRISGQNILN